LPALLCPVFDACYHKNLSSLLGLTFIGRFTTTTHPRAPEIPQTPQASVNPISPPIPPRPPRPCQIAPLPGEAIQSISDSLQPFVDFLSEGWGAPDYRPPRPHQTVQPSPLVEFLSEGWGAPEYQPPWRDMQTNRPCQASVGAPGWVWAIGYQVLGDIVVSLAFPFINAPAWAVGLFGSGIGFVIRNWGEVNPGELASEMLIGMVVGHILGPLPVNLNNLFEILLHEGGRFGTVRNFGMA